MDNKVLHIKDVNDAELVHNYLDMFLKTNCKNISDFNRVCFEVVIRVLWRFIHYGLGNYKK